MSKRIWKEQNKERHHSWRNRQWNALEKDGYFTGHYDYGFTSEALVLTGKGVEAATTLGLDPVNPPAAKSLWHDDDLISAVLKLEKAGLISGWLTEQELKMGRMKDLFRHSHLTKAKHPDLVLRLKHPTDKILWAVELERTRKQSIRYYEMVRSYTEPSQLNAVVIVAATPSIERNIKHAQERLKLANSRRPLLFADQAKFVEAPGTAELRMGNKKTSIATAVAGWAAPKKSDSPMAG